MLLSICFAKQVVWQHICQLHLLQRHLHHHHVNCVSCDYGFGRLTCSSFILVLTDTTFLLFFMSHIDITFIADSGTPYTCLPRNSFLILFICVIIASFWHSFATLFSVSPIPFSPFCHVAADIFYCCLFH